MKLREKIFIWFIALVYLMGQMGCATGRYEYPPAEPLSEAYRAQLETIGVMSVSGAPDIHFERPLTASQPGILTRMGQGALEGGKTSGGWMVDVCSLGTTGGYGVQKSYIAPGAIVLAGIIALWGACWVLTVPVTLVGGLGGFFYGAIPSFPDYPHYVEDTEMIFRDTLAKYPIQEKFQHAFLKKARFRTPHTFVEIQEEGAWTAEEMADQEVATVLELIVQRIGLERGEDREGDMNPPTVLSLVVQARLIQATEKTVWYDQFFVHKTEKRPYTYWRHLYNPYGFPEDLQQAYKKLAEEMVKKLFYQKPPEQPSTPSTSDTSSAFSTETTLSSQP